MPLTGKGFVQGIVAGPYDIVGMRLSLNRGCHDLSRFLVCSGLSRAVHTAAYRFSLQSTGS